jgi:uncharacterized membrane protein
MNTYLVLKWLHIVSSVLMVGTGLGSAFYMFFTNRSGSVPAQAVVSRLVVRADWWFTTPTVILQPVTGFALAHMAGWPLSTPWLALSLGPVRGRRHVLAAGGVAADPNGRHCSSSAHRDATALPPLYARYQRYWELLGYPAFVAMAVVFWLMVNKPQLSF